MDFLLLIQDRLSVVVAVSAWLLTLFWVVQVSRLKNRFVVLGFGYLSVFAVGMTLEVNAVFLWFDRVTGIPNLAWLLAWISITTSAYLITCTFYMVREKPIPLWLHLLFATVTVIYVIIFLGGIRHTPEWPAHVMPRNMYDFIFMQSLFLVAGLIFILTSRNVAYVYRHEEALIAKIGWGRVWVMTAVATGFFASRSVLTTVAYWWPESRIIVYLYGVSLFFFVLPAILIPCLHMPNWATLYLAKPFLSLNKLWTLRQLMRLQSRINEFCSPVVLEQVDWREAIKAPDFHTYRSIVGILDGKGMLEAYLASLGLLAHETNAWLIYRYKDNPQQWDTQKRIRALDLFEKLKPVSDEIDIPELAIAYRRVGRKI